MYWNQGIRNGASEVLETFCFFWYDLVKALYPGRPEQMMGFAQEHDENRAARYVSVCQLKHRRSSMKLLRVPVMCIATCISSPSCSLPHAMHKIAAI